MSTLVFEPRVCRGFSSHHTSRHFSYLVIRWYRPAHYAYPRRYLGEERDSQGQSLLKGIVPKDKKLFWGNHEAELEWFPHNEPGPAESDSQFKASECRDAALQIEDHDSFRKKVEWSMEDEHRFGLGTITGPFPSHANNPAWTALGYRLPPDGGDMVKVAGPRWARWGHAPSPC